MIETVESDVPDLVSLTALLRPSRYVESGATVVMTFQKGLPFPGDPWTISGEKDELKFTAQGGTTPRTMASGDVKIMLHDFSTGEFTVAEIEKGVCSLLDYVGESESFDRLNVRDTTLG